MTREWRRQAEVLRSADRVCGSTVNKKRHKSGRRPVINPFTLAALSLSLSVMIRNLSSCAYMLFAVLNRRHNFFLS